MSSQPEFDLMRESFIPETRDLLETANDALLALEADPANQDAVNRLFRAVHTIKGTAGIFDLPMLVQLVHAAEDLLGAVREGKVALTARITDDMLDCFDHVGRWIETLDETGALPANSGEIARERAVRYRSYLAGDAVVSIGDRISGASASDMLPDWFCAEPEELIAKLPSGTPDDIPLVVIRYEPLPECFFSGEDPLHLVRQLPEVHWIRIEPREPWAARADFDPYACNLRFLALSSAPRETIEHLLRYVLRETQIATVTAGVLHGRTAPKEAPQAEVLHFPGATQNNLLSVAREILAAQGRILENSASSEAAASAKVSAANALAAAGVAVDHSAFERACEDAIAQRSAAGFSQFVDQHLHVAPVVKRGGTETAPDTSARPRPESSERALKVEPSKIDALVNLVGELIVAKNALPFLAQRADGVYGSRELAREIKDQYGVVDRIAQEMQGAIMSIRMLPVSEMFKRFPRLVRDISRKLDKSVELVVEGETTEADKNVIEALADPLVHVVRNSLDHGIETLDDRRMAGKPETARIFLKACQEGDSVLIEVIDDGRGIDPERVKAKAVAKGLLDEERAAALTDAEAVQLVFFPGFSTVDQISDLSGRGVGMDVVRSTVEKLGGTAVLTSSLGEGTTVRLKLPLSMAVTRVMTVEAGGQLFGIPMDLVVETVRIPKAGIRRIKRSEAFILRDTLVPLVRLRTILAMDRHEPTEEAVLVVRIAGAPLGLIIDDFRTGMEVILKPLTGILSGVPGYSGTAVLGDGKVLLVLNLKELI